MNDLDRELRDAARNLDVPTGDVDVVVALGRRRSRRRQRVLGATAVLAVAGASLTVARLAADDDDGAPVTALGAPSASAGDAAMTWTTAEPRSVLAMLSTDPAVEVDGRVYALSTAPGEADPNATEPTPLRLWSSSDGVDWQVGPEPDDDLYLSDLAAADGRIYAIGTGQATAAIVDGRRVPSVNVGWTTTDAEDWTSSTLDIDYAAIAEHATSVSLAQRSVAAGRSGVVAVVGVTADLDVPEVVPAGDPAPERWAITATGVDVLGERHDDVCDDRDVEDANGPHRVWPVYCGGRRGGNPSSMAPQDAYDVERSYTWDELGVHGDLLRAVLGEPFVFVGDADGATFDRVELPATTGLTSWGILQGGDDGFDLALSTMDPDPSLVYLHSDDGRSWTAGPNPGDLSWASAAGVVAGRTVITGSDEQNHAVVLVRAPGAGWQTVRPESFLGDALVDGRSVYSVGGGVGPLGVAQVLMLTDESSDESSSEVVLAFSRDGSTWEITPLDDVVGEQVNGVGRVVVTGSRVVVMVIPAQDRAEGEHLRQVAVVGTPS